MLHTSFGFTTACLVGRCNRVYPCLGKFFTHLLNVFSQWFDFYSGQCEASAKASLLLGGEQNKKKKDGERLRAFFSISCVFTVL